VSERSQAPIDMWEEGLIFMLIYLGVFLILPDKLKHKILSNRLLCIIILSGFVLGLVGIIVFRKQTDSFSVTQGCDTTGTPCSLQDSTKPFCLVNERLLPSADIDQTLVFNLYGRYVRIYPSAAAQDTYMALSQVVVNDATGANIAIGKTATSASQYAPQSVPLPPSVISGSLTPQEWPNVWNNNGKGLDDWWQVDLGSVQMITTVRVISRKDLPPGTLPNRNTGVRVQVLEALTDVTTRQGRCIAMPTAIYPAGVTPTAAEKAVIDPMILDGYNPTIALKIYRGVSSTTNTFTPHGLTDSQSADAVLKIKSSNLIAARKAGTLSDTQYFSQANAIKGIKTMAGIAFNIPTEIQTYMKANVKSNVDPVTGTITGDDGGKEQVTKLVMSVLMPNSIDPAVGFTNTTTSDFLQGIKAPPDTGKWAQIVVKDIPQQTETISIPKSGATTITDSMTPDEKLSATLANNPNMIVITPDMSEDKKAVAIATANAAQNTGNTGTKPISQNQMDAAAEATITGQGYKSPNMPLKSLQWYMRQVSVPSSSASAQCEAYGATLATYEQIQDAQKKGASVNAYGWYEGTTTIVIYPNTTGIKTTTPSTSTYYTNCYGPKPDIGSDVSPWTDTAKTIPGGATYTANDWSQRIGGDGGVDKNPDGSIKFPGTALLTGIDAKRGKDLESDVADKVSKLDDEAIARAKAATQGVGNQAALPTDAELAAMKKYNQSLTDTWAIVAQVGEGNGNWDIWWKMKSVGAPLNREDKMKIVNQQRFMMTIYEYSAFKSSASATAFASMYLRKTDAEIRFKQMCWALDINQGDVVLSESQQKTVNDILGI